MTEATTTPPTSEPVAGPVQRKLGQAAEARWYCLDRDGVAMLCKDEEDARAQAAENDDCWPGRAPHRAVLMCEVSAADAHIPMARLIELETAEHERDILRTDNAKLAREAHTWSKAAETYAADAERFRWLAEHTVATGLARWVHPFQFLGEAVDARRKLNRPPTPVGWSDTDWLKHLEEIRQDQETYHRGPLPETGWD